jgi:predicted RNase H-like nuclease (RuvC/YqgF family)
MIYSKRRRGGQRKYYTRKSFRVKRYKHYGAGGKPWMSDEDEKSIEDLVNQLSKMNPGDERIQLENQLKQKLSSIVEKAEKEKNDAQNEFKSIHNMILSIKGSVSTNNLIDDDKRQIEILHTQLEYTKKILEMMRFNHNEALTYKKEILNIL